jgi:NAD-dependent SIR2 family protein deacetylase
MWPVAAPFLTRLEAEPDWVPMCPACGECCLRPNVMIFGDGSLVESAIGAQQRRMEGFTARFGGRWVVLEVGAGVVVPSIRCYAEALGGRGDGGLIRVNPSRSECEQMQQPSSSVAGKYFPLVARSTDALKAICDGLRLPPSPLGDAGALCDVVGAQAAEPPPPSASAGAAGEPT